MLLLTSIFVLYWCRTAQTANIFAIITYPTKSHSASVENLLKMLTERGHVVDFATHYPSKENLPRYNEMSLQGCLPLRANNLSVHHYEGFTSFDIMSHVIKGGGVDACRAILKTPLIQNLKRTQKRYDLVMTEIFGSDCFLGFGRLFDAPVISVVASTDMPWTHDRVANIDNPSYIPNWYGSLMSKLDFFDRLENTILWIISKLLYRFVSVEGSNQLGKEFFGYDVANLETSFILTLGDFTTSPIRPTVPNFIQVGGIHIHEATLLNQHFENLVKTDIIYLSMGSQLMTETFAREKLEGMFDAFGTLPYKVLWKADKDKFPKNLTIPKNINFEKWMPQIDILCHPSTKLFVTHGGLLSTQEAIYCGVPRLVVPFFADQENNARASEVGGTAVVVAYSDVKKETILEATRKLLNNDNYKRNAERMSQIFKDRPLSPLETAVFWTEYIIRHKGAPHLRSPGVQLSWYHYYLIDIGFLTIVILTTFVLVYCLWSRMTSNDFKSENK